MVIEISVAIIAISFAALVIYLIILMKTFRENLREVKKILENTDDISLDFRNKIESLDPFFHSITNLGEILENKTEAFKRYMIAPFEPEASIKQSRTEALSRRIEARAEASLKQDLNEEFKKDILEFTGLGIRLLKNLKRR